MSPRRPITDRRRFLGGGLLATGALFARRAFAGATLSPQHEHSRDAATAEPPALASATAPAVEPGAAIPRGVVALETPDVPNLPWRWVDGAKEFHLVCEVVPRRFLPWREPFNVWGYNGSMPGPTVEVMEGDRVRFVVENRLPEPTSMHWHGLELPFEMDGVPGLNQDLIPPGGFFVYEFALHQNGTFFYHSHLPMQEMMGMIGLFVIHPKAPHAPRVDRDFGLVFQEWAMLPNNPTPNTLAMEFNWLTINGKVGPATTPMLVKHGERVRLRMVNMGMDHHPIHLHGQQFQVVGSESGRIPRSAWEPGNTVLLGVAQARDVEFEAAYLGEWMLHCHLPHHMMNHMASMVGPMTEGSGGVAANLSMERGMGIAHGGHALSAENGPSMGRALDGSDEERAVGHAMGAPDSGAAAGGHGSHGGMGAAPGAGSVPGYPQDMFMVADQAFAEKPECWGLRPGWTGGMMGMMNLVRVLPAALYDTIQELRQRKREDPSFQLPPPPPRSAFLGHEPVVIDPAPFAARYAEGRS